jgi:hypothetical protein
MDLNQSGVYKNRVWRRGRRRRIKYEAVRDDTLMPAAFKLRTAGQEKQRKVASKQGRSRSRSRGRCSGRKKQKQKQRKVFRKEEAEQGREEGQEERNKAAAETEEVGTGHKTSSSSSHFPWLPCLLLLALPPPCGPFAAAMASPRFPLLLP